MCENSEIGIEPIDCFFILFSLAISEYKTVCGSIRFICSSFTEKFRIFLGESLTSEILRECYVPTPNFNNTSVILYGKRSMVQKIVEMLNADLCLYTDGEKL